MLKAYFVGSSRCYIFLELVRYEGEIWWAIDWSEWMWVYKKNYINTCDDILTSMIFLGHYSLPTDFLENRGKWRSCYSRGYAWRLAEKVIINDRCYRLFKKYSPKDIRFNNGRAHKILKGRSD